jgi:hypothetical protein
MAYNSLQPSGPDNRYDFNSPEQSRVTGTKNPLGLPPRSGMGGLAASSSDNSSVYQGIMADREKINKLELENKNLMEEQEGPSRFAADASAIGGLGLGIASYFENKKTSQLQRKQMKQNLQASADYNQGRKDRAASWSAAQARPAREINA